MILSVPLLIIAMGSMVGPQITRWMSPKVFGWLQVALATPVVFRCGWPLLVRGAKKKGHSGRRRFAWSGGRGQPESPDNEQYPAEPVLCLHL